MTFDIRRYTTVDGIDRFGEWFVLLLGGDKRKQQADIKQAKEYWRDYQERTKTKGKRNR